MVDHSAQRRLSAILAADVAGYTRLMEQDTDGTVAAWQAARENVIKPGIADHSGEIVKLTGDGFLVEFPTVHDAVACAIALQSALAASVLDFRMGVNLGDIVDDGEDIHGEGVNIAARIEGLAEPGGICITGTVYEQVRNRIEAIFEDIGEQRVKNVSRPIQVYRVRTGSSTPRPVDTPKNNKRLLLVTAAIIVIAVGVGIGWLRPWNPGTAPATMETTNQAQGETPSIAVLPFTNMSGDQEQEYFSDGMTEDLITDLSKISALTVISRTSTFAYKGKSPDVRDVAKDLNVRYVVEGSVRKAGSQVRITAQLIDATTGEHVWAERYDRDYKDIFALQDEVLGKIVSALAVTLTPDEERRIAKPLTGDPLAYDLYLKGLRQESYFTKEGNLESQKLFLQAIDRDPTFAAAHAHLAQAYSLAVENRWTETPDEMGKKAVETALQGIRLDDELPYAYWSLGRIYTRAYVADPEKGKIAFKKAIALNPNYADGYMFLAITHIFTGQAEKSEDLIEKAMRINPRYPFWYLQTLGMAQFFTGQHAAAVESLRESINRNPNVAWTRRYVIAMYGQLGMVDEAEWEISELGALGQPATIKDFMAETSISDPVYRKKYEDGLRKAGLPEG